MSYRFVGPGRGVPGLPHEIESKASLDKSQQEILADALKAGTYEEVKPPSKKGEEGSSK